MDSYEWGYWDFPSNRKVPLNLKGFSMEELDINYDKLVEKSLKHVVIEALKIAADEGLPGEHHFYITFKTSHPNARISAQLLNQYPDEMTIVLQHQFANLMVGETYFEVDLSFGGIPQTLRIPYDAIIYFADPHAKFGLSFNSGDELMNKNIDSDDFVEEKKVKKASGSATVIDIEAFRKK